MKVGKRVVTAIVVCFLAACQGLAQEQDKKTIGFLLSRSLVENRACIWYLTNSGWPSGQRNTFSSLTTSAQTRHPAAHLYPTAR
jgi:hypothetical protein